MAVLGSNSLAIVHGLFNVMSSWTHQRRQSYVSAVVVLIDCLFTFKSIKFRSTTPSNELVYDSTTILTLTFLSILTTWLTLLLRCCCYFLKHWLPSDLIRDFWQSGYFLGENLLAFRLNRCKVSYYWWVSESTLLIHNLSNLSHIDY